MTHSIDGRVAIITGAGGGLGREHALFLARKGSRVVVNDVTLAAAEAVAAEIVASGGVASALAASVTDEAAVAAMVSDVIAKWGRVDILVNNAGILRDKTFAKMSLEEFRLVLEVHRGRLDTRANRVGFETGSLARNLSRSCANAAAVA